MKLYACLLLASTLFLSATPVSHAAAYQSIEVTIDGVRQQFAQPGVLIQGNAMVPMRAIFERLGATVDWQPSTQTVKAKKGDTVIQLTLLQRKAVKNGQEMTLAAPAQSVNGNTVVPLRFVSEALGGKVHWEKETNTAHIVSAEGTRGAIDVPAAYAPILTSLVDAKGILQEDTELMSDATGVAYVDFIDFDNDGTVELYVVYADYEEGDYVQPFYKEEIWSNRGGQTSLLYEKEFSNGGLIDDAARSIVTSEGRSYLVESGSYSAGGRGNYPDGSEYGSWHLFYGLKNGTFAEAVSARMTEVYFEEDSGKQDLVLYSIEQNGVVNDVTKAEHDRLLESYGMKQAKRVIDSSAGAKGLAFDVGASAARIAGMMESIRPQSTDGGEATLFESKLGFALKIPHELYRNVEIQERPDRVSFYYIENELLKEKLFLMSVYRVDAKEWYGNEEHNPSSKFLVDTGDSVFALNAAAETPFGAYYDLDAEALQPVAVEPEKAYIAAFKWFEAALMDAFE